MYSELLDSGPWCPYMYTTCGWEPTGRVFVEVFYRGFIDYEKILVKYGSSQFCNKKNEVFQIPKKTIEMSLP